MTQQTQTMLTVGERLKIARERAGVSVQQMADHLGRHRNRVTAYESASSLDSELIARYAEYLGNVAPEWLAYEIGESPITHRKHDATMGLSAHSVLIPTEPMAA